MTPLLVVVAVVISLVIGLAVGGLGGGGGVLTVPALVFLLGQTPQAAATAGLVIVGTSAVIGVVARLRQVRWAAGAALGAVGTVAAVGGTAVSRHLDRDVLLLAFAGLVLLAAYLLARSSRDDTDDAGDDPCDGVDEGADEGADGPAGGGVATLPRTRIAADVRRRAVTTVVVGAAVGFATGLFGVGGGFLAVPALVVLLGWEMPAAAATSLLVIVVNAVASLGARVATETPDWAVIVPVAAAAVVGTVLGKLVADRLSSAVLGRAFAGLLVGVAAYTAATSVVALV